MTDDHILSEEELRTHLDEQIGFLERSAEAFDTGYDGEAKRLAVTLRVLLHDKKQSRSLLGQLRMKDREFADTAHGIAPGNQFATHTLIGVRFTEGSSGYAALLDTNEAKAIAISVRDFLEPGRDDRGQDQSGRTSDWQARCPSLNPKAYYFPEMSGRSYRRRELPSSETEVSHRARAEGHR